MLPTHALAALAPAAAVLLLARTAGADSTGTTTRYWDCCKPSCAWPGKASLAEGPVRTCNKNDQPLSDGGATKSGCQSGGGAYMCSSQSPWAVNDTVAYGYAAVRIAGSSESQWCCACYALTFTSGPVQGKTLVVQATNTGGDLGSNHFDLAIPGGGVGEFNACTQQYGAPPNGWGDRYGGVHTAADCASFPAALKPGCEWRFGWFAGADNPSVTFHEVSCPSELTAKTGCRRN